MSIPTIPGMVHTATLEDKDMAPTREAEGSGDQGRDADGCHVSTATGFVLLLLGVVLAVGVGLIVFFAAGRETTCNCHFPRSLDEETQEAQVQFCNTLGENTRRCE